MKKFSLWGLPAIVLVIVLGLVVLNHYVLDSQKLDAAIKTELPLGTPKAEVIQFIQARKPMFWEDLGTRVKNKDNWPCREFSLPQGYSSRFRV
jgi:hypothetical protein